jgi:hypothetical protein
MFTLVRTTPGSSLFPEIDFASKIPRETSISPYSFQNLLSTLSLANTFEITRALANSKLHVKMNFPSPETEREKPTAVFEYEIEDGDRMSDTAEESEPNLREGRQSTD